MLSLKMLKLLKAYTCNFKSLTQLRGKQHYISGGDNYNKFYLLKLFENTSIINSTTLSQVTKLNSVYIFIL